MADNKHFKLKRLEPGTYATPDGRFLVAQGVFYGDCQSPHPLGGGGYCYGYAEHSYTAWAVIPVNDDGSDGEPLADEFKTKGEAAAWLADHLGLTMPPPRRKAKRRVIAPTAPPAKRVAQRQAATLKPGDILLGVFGEPFDRPLRLVTAEPHLGDLWRLVTDDGKDFYWKADEFVGVEVTG